jgi:hypothetical protein
MEPHHEFDLVLRRALADRTGLYQYAPELLGTCGSVEGRSGDVARIASGYLPSPPHLAPYIAAAGLTGVKAVVTPIQPGNQKVTGLRVLGSPCYAITRQDDLHWCWEPVPGTEAGAVEHIEGFRHQVAIR